MPTPGSDHPNTTGSPPDAQRDQYPCARGTRNLMRRNAETENAARRSADNIGTDGSTAREIGLRAGSSRAARAILARMLPGETLRRIG